MAYRKKTLSGDYGNEYLEDAQAATALAVDAGAVTVRKIVVDLKDNTNEDVTLRLWNAAVGGVTVGTTAAFFWFKFPKGKRRTIRIGGSGNGLNFATALTAAVVKEDGGTGGNTAPSGTVKVRIIAS